MVARSAMTDLLSASFVRSRFHRVPAITKSPRLDERRDANTSVIFALLHTLRVQTFKELSRKWMANIHKGSSFQLFEEELSLLPRLSPATGVSNATGGASDARYTHGSPGDSSRITDSPS